MEIDEMGLFRMSRRKESDHNTIVLKIKICRNPEQKPQKCTQWRLKAPEDDWKLEAEMHEQFTSQSYTLDEKYRKWIKKIESAARISIGKTTVKNSNSEKFSAEVKQLRKEKRQIKTL